MFKIIITILLFFISGLYASLDVSKKLKTGVGFYSEGLTSAGYKDAKLGLQLWVTELAGGEDIDVDVLFYDDFETMIKDFKTKKIESVILSPYIFVKYKSLLEPIVLGGWTARVSKDRLHSYHLIGRKDANYEKNRAFSTVLQEKDLLSKMVLDKSLLESGKKSEEVKYTRSYSRAIMDVFFGKNDLCVVPEHSWKTISEMNPQVKKKLYIIKTSPQIFMPMLSIFHKDMTPFLREAYAKVIKNFSDTPRGKQLLTLFKVQDVKKFDIKMLMPLENYYNDFLAFQKSRNK